MEEDKYKLLGKVNSGILFYSDGIEMDFEYRKWINIIGVYEKFSSHMGSRITKIIKLGNISNLEYCEEKDFAKIIKKYKKNYNIKNNIHYTDVFFGLLPKIHSLLGRYTYTTAIIAIEKLGTQYNNKMNRYLPRILQEAFPNVQFIVTTDNPVIIQNSGVDAITYKIEKYKSDIEAKRINNIVSMDYNDILSLVLDVESSYSIDVEEINEKQNQIAYGNTVEPLTDKECEILRIARKRKHLNPELEVEILKFLKERDKI